MDESTVARFEESLARCNADPRFLDRFYQIFLGSSPKVHEMFVNTNFVHQKRALRASLQAMVLAAEDEQHASKYLEVFAERHSSRDLKVGAELYDLWLDSLMAAVKECDPQCSPEVLALGSE